MTQKKFLSSIEPAGFDSTAYLTGPAVLLAGSSSSSSKPPIIIGASVAAGILLLIVLAAVLVIWQFPNVLPNCIRTSTEV